MFIEIGFIWERKNQEVIVIKLLINENPNLLNILVIDCGIKNSQIRALLRHNVQLTIVNTNYNFINEVLNNKYDGIFKVMDQVILLVLFCSKQLKNHLKVKKYSNIWNLLWSSINRISFWM